MIPGLERLDSGPPLRDSRIGLVLHPASVTRDLELADRYITRLMLAQVAALFGPQHGIRGEKQDNMIESASFRDARRDIPVFSLYSDVRKPTPEMLEGLDAVVFDLQDVGVRIYTFATTLLLTMEACGAAGIPVVVCDRPNPVTGTLREGPLLRDGYRSFVGPAPIPLRHGLTLGELGRLAVGEFGIACELHVIPCEGWRRDTWFDDTGLPFVLPSPNLPTVESCVVYPGMVLLEGTNLSEGRGTTKPFELFGAPYLDADDLVETLDGFELPGVRFRACSFEPTYQKHAGQLCGGAQLHVTDRETFRPVWTAVAILRAAKDLAPEEFAWRPPPYEYEYEKPPIDILWGSSALREEIDSGAGVEEVMRDEAREIGEFDLRVRPYLIY